jgi:hypothetical protein
MRRFMQITVMQSCRLVMQITNTLINSCQVKNTFGVHIRDGGGTKSLKPEADFLSGVCGATASCSIFGQRFHFFRYSFLICIFRFSRMNSSDHKNHKQIINRTLSQTKLQAPTYVTVWILFQEQFKWPEYPFEKQIGWTQSFRKAFFKLRLVNLCEKDTMYTNNPFSSFMAWFMFEP